MCTSSSCGVCAHKSEEGNERELRAGGKEVKRSVVMTREGAYLQLSSQNLCDCKYITMETTAPQHHVL